MIFERLRQMGRREDMPRMIREQVLFSAASDVGSVREQNQDNLFLMRPVLTHDRLRHYAISGAQELPALFAVCDGMGGGQCGEQASYTAARRIARTDVSGLEKLDDRELELFFTGLYEEMNREVFEQFGHLKALVGCTATLLYIDRRRVYLVNAGDSPGMCLDGRGLRVLTQSDNRANQLYLLGQISEQERWTHKTKNQLTQHIGMDEREVRVSPHICRIERQDMRMVFLICSDGLLDRNSFPGLEQQLREKTAQNRITECARCCVASAVEAGSRDNISAIVVQVEARHDKG
jgi:protein phosphatase